MSFVRDDLFINAYLKKVNMYIIAMKREIGINHGKPFYGVHMLTKTLRRLIQKIPLSYEKDPILYFSCHPIAPRGPFQHQQSGKHSKSGGSDLLALPYQK